jgi:peroxin-3
MEQVRDLEAFAAVVYSSNWESEINPVNADSEIASKSGLVVPPEVSTGQDSLVDVGSASTFESAWGKAVDAVDEKTLT